MPQVKKQKKVDYRKMSTKTCKDCFRPIKQNVADRIPDVNRCYCCHLIFEGKILTGKKIIENKEVFVKLNLHRMQARNRRVYNHPLANKKNVNN
jgi:hypothetical protein